MKKLILLVCSEPVSAKQVHINHDPWLGPKKSTLEIAYSRRVLKVESQKSPKKSTYSEILDLQTSMANVC